MNDSPEGIKTLKPIEFDQNAKRFFSNKLVKELNALAASMEESEIFMADESIPTHEIAKLLRTTKKFAQISDALNRFHPMLEFQLMSLMKGKDYADLDHDALIRKLENKMRDAFKGIDFSERPVLKIIADEFAYIIRLCVVKYKQPSENIKDEATANILNIRKFAESLGGRIKPELATEAMYRVKADRIHSRFREAIIEPTDGEVVLKIKADGGVEFVKSASAVKSKQPKSFEFLTVKMIFDSNGEEKSFLSTISLACDELNGWGSNGCSLKYIFGKLGVNAYQYIRFKIFDAVEDAILEDRLHLDNGDRRINVDRRVENETAPLEERREEVRRQIGESLGAEDDITEETTPRNKGKVKKRIEGGGQFLNIKHSRAVSAMKRMEGVVEIQSTKHGHIHSFRKLVDGKIVQANLLPSRNHIDSNPVYIKNALDAFHIEYGDFLNEV